MDKNRAPKMVFTQMSYDQIPAFLDQQNIMQLSKKQWLWYTKKVCQLIRRKFTYSMVLTK